MTEKDIVKLFALLTAAYPRFDTFSDPAKVRPVIKLWAELLADIPYDVAETAAKKLMLESPYPPTIADVRKQITEITTPKEYQIDAAEAWGEVMQAIRHYGYYRPNEALSSLSPQTAKVVRYIGWNEINTCEEIGVVRGQFLKMFDAVSKRETQNRHLPIGLRDMIQGIAAGMSINALSDGNSPQKTNNPLWEKEEL